MRLKEFINNSYIRTKDGISRFFAAFICSVLMFITLSFDILFSSVMEDELMGSLCLTYALTAVISVLFTVATEQLERFTNKVYQYFALAIISIASFCLIYANYNSDYTAMVYTGIIISTICFIFFCLMQGEHRSLVFSRLVSSLFFTGTVCGILSAGISTCIAAFDNLIFNYNDIWDVYLIFNLLVWTVIFVNLFLSSIPEKDKEVPQSKIYKAFVLYAGLPLYMLLITILLIYLAKIVVTRHMPVGEINWFASFASLFFIFFLLSVMQYEEKAAKLFAKFGGYLLIPVIIMQAIAVFERINAYGLTTPRTVSLVLILISMLFIGAAIIAPKHINKIALASGIIVLIVTVTPLNVIDMPIASQTKILENVLIKNNMIKDGRVIPNSNVSDEDATILFSAYDYLKFNADSVPDFIPDSEKNNKDIFGIDAPMKDSHINDYVYCSYHSMSAIDITGYDRMIEATDRENIIEIEYKGERYDVNVKELSQELYNTYGEKYDLLELYVINDDIALYIKSLSFDMRNGQFEYPYFDGYVLLKN